MRFVIMIAAVMFSFSANALEIKLNDATWVPKLSTLCDAARYGSRMTAEPICNDLAAVVQQQQAEAAKAAASVKPDDDPSKTK